MLFWLRELEQTVLRMAQRQLNQQGEIDRLKAELSMVQTEPAVESSRPWPRHVW